MPDAIANKIRKGQTDRELERLLPLLAKWTASWAAADRNANDEYVGHHKTQIEALQLLFDEAARGLASELAKLSPEDHQRGEFYERCREIERSAVWLLRLGEYYKRIFDQRSWSNPLRPLLDAADEVVWSCYQPVWLRAQARNPNLTAKPAPLTYVDMEYSPAALDSNGPLPTELVPGGNLKFLDRFLRSLPVALLRLPPWCEGSPWWLVYIAHETGHHLQATLQLTRTFREGVEQTARDRKLKPDFCAAWRRWSEEIFADFFSICMVGGWAVWSILEAENNRPEAFWNRTSGRYPAPGVRVVLMKEFAARIGIPPGPYLDEFDPTTAPAAEDIQADLAFAPFLADYAATILPDMCAVPKNGFDASSVVQWRQQLLSQSALAPEQNIDEARHIVSAALHSWKDVAESSLSHPDIRDHLASRTMEAILQSAPEGTRLAQDAAEEGKGIELAALLLRNAHKRRGRR